MAIDWSKIVTQGLLKIGSKEEAKQLGIYPNRPARFENVGGIVVFQSESDFALGVKSLEYIERMLQEKKIDEAVILLIRQVADHLEPADVLSIDRVKSIVANRTPDDGKWGRYWWIAIGLDTEPTI